jgi:hypothetical protein
MSTRTGAADTRRTPEPDVPKPGADDADPDTRRTADPDVTSAMAATLAD